MSRGIWVKPITEEIWYEDPYEAVLKCAGVAQVSAAVIYCGCTCSWVVVYGSDTGDNEATGDVCPEYTAGVGGSCW